MIPSGDQAKVAGSTSSSVIPLHTVTCNTAPGLPLGIARRDIFYELQTRGDFLAPPLTKSHKWNQNTPAVPSRLKHTSPIPFTYSQIRKRLRYAIPRFDRGTTGDFMARRFSTKLYRCDAG